MIFGSSQRRQREALIAGLYGKVAAAARAPGIYAEMGAADTVEGRFEVLALHMALILRRLGQLPGPADSVAGELTDYFFAALDGALREIGIGDMGIGRRMKSLASGFLGRANAYDAALADAAPAEALARAIHRNVFRGADAGEAGAALLALHSINAAEALSRSSLDDILSERGTVFSSAAGTLA